MVEIQGDVITALQLVTVLGCVDVFLGVVPGTEPEIIDAGILTFNDAHAARHGCTLDDAKGYVRAAKCTVRRKRWDGVSINCYSLDGAAYIDADTMKVKTAFSEKDFDPTTKAIAEVFR